MLIDKEIIKSALVKYILEVIFQTSSYSKYKKKFFLYPCGLLKSCVVLTNPLPQGLSLFICKMKVLK